MNKSLNEMPAAKVFTNLNQVTDEIFRRLGRDIKLATPLGLGKPNALLNAIYSRVKNEPGLRLKIFTALSLNPPELDSPLAGKFLEPFVERQWGLEYPKLQYALDAENGKLPKNVIVHEFYFKAGAALKSKSLQQHYQSINYTQVAKAVFDQGIQVMVQMIAKRGDKYSLSCNPDVTLDLMELYRLAGKPLLRVGVVHPELPFMGGDAELTADNFDLILEDPQEKSQLFAVPRMPVSPADHIIGLYASQLVADGGTLQIGIGSLSDAVVASLLFRHSQNENFKKLVAGSIRNPAAIQNLPMEQEPFFQGIYGLSEMVTDAYMHFRKAGILKRWVSDEKSGLKTYLHGAFYLGSKDLYEWLRKLDGEDYSGLRMTRVSKVNDLYDPNEILLRRQRVHGRFLNTCMQVTLLGAAASETLEDGRVVSGVGGQYNFVAMAQELQGSRSILMLRSTREDRGKRISNIVKSHGHLTIPRHLRDIVITEYGIADLRNKSDEECIRALIEIADGEFQQGLIREAWEKGKLADDYRLPEHARNNTPERLQELIQQGRSFGAFKPFPLGSDFTPTEEKLALALNELKKWSAGNKWQLIKKFMSPTDLPQAYDRELERMDLKNPRSLKEKIIRRLLTKALAETEV